MVQKSTNRIGLIYFVLALALSCSGTAIDSLANSSTRLAEPSNASSLTYRNLFSRESSFEILPAIADLDGDHIPDVAFGSLVESTYGIKIHLTSHPQKVFLPTHIPPLGAVLIAYDINHDQDLDLVIASPGFFRPISVWLGNGKGRFKESISSPIASLLGWGRTSVAINDDAGILQTCLLNDGSYGYEYFNNNVVDFRLKKIGKVAGHNLIQYSRGNGQQLNSRSPPLFFPL
jgi:hypothetical protein